MMRLQCSLICVNTYHKETHLQSTAVEFLIWNVYLFIMLYWQQNLSIINPRTLFGTRWEQVLRRVTK